MQTTYTIINRLYLIQGFKRERINNNHLACRYCLHMVLSMQTCLYFNSFETSLRPNKMCFATPIGVETRRLGTNALAYGVSILWGSTNNVLY